MESQKLKGQKNCPACGATNSVSATKCKCGASLNAQFTVQPSVRTPKKMHPNKIDRRETVTKNAPIAKTFVPGYNEMQRAAQVEKRLPQKSIKPNKKNISDDDVEVVSQEHLDQVQQSAESLGL